MQERCFGVLRNKANAGGWRIEQCFQDNECMQLINLLRNVTWTLSNFCRGKPQPQMKYIRPAIQALTNMLTIPDPEIAQDACWAFSYISDDDSNPSQKSNSQNPNHNINNNNSFNNNNNNQKYVCLFIYF